MKGLHTMKKSRLLPLFLLLLAVVLLPHVSAAGEEIRGYLKGSGWQYLQMGEYPYEEDGTPAPVLWRILSVDDGQILVLTEYVVDQKQIIFETDQKIIEKHAFRRISSYPESDLYPWLNTEGMDLMFGQDPIRAAVIEVPELGLLYPLPDTDLLNDQYGFSRNRWGEELNAHPDRQAVCTPYAKAKGLYVHHDNRKSPYWCVAIKGASDYKFGLVGYNGHISWGAYTNSKVAGLRLAVRLDRNKVRITGGSGTKDDPFILEAAEPTEIVTEVSGQEETFPTPGANSPSNPEASSIADHVSGAISDSAPTEAPVPEEDTVPEWNQVVSGEEPASSAEPDTVLISLVGDCSIGDAIGSIKRLNSYHSVIDREGYAWPFSLVKKYLAEDDLTVANLEVVFTERTGHKDIKYPLRGAPDHVNVLLEGSIEAVNTVNNHCMDYRNEGYEDSLAVLDEAGIGHFGSVNYAYANNAHDDLLVREIRGIRFGFVGMTYPQSRDLDPLIERIRKLKEEEGCDIVIVSLHWGRETHLTNTSSQAVFARQLIDGGADVIYGHHPHVLQPMVFYKDKPILFSTGNFTFGTMSQVDPHTGIFRLTYRKDGDRVLLSSIEVIPCRTSGPDDYRPFELTDEAERKKTWQILSPRSAPYACEAAPDDFRESGIVRFDDNGNVIRTAEP